MMQCELKHLLRITVNHGDCCRSIPNHQLAWLGGIAGCIRRQELRCRLSRWLAVTYYRAVAPQLHIPATSGLQGPCNTE